jgi:hypothetical protein
VEIVLFLAFTSTPSLFLLWILWIEAATPSVQLNQHPVDYAVPETIKKAYLCAIAFDEFVNGKTSPPSPSGQP